MGQPTQIKNHILSIAIDRYENCSVFYNNVENSEHLLDVLVSKYQFEERLVTRLNNRQATKHNILFKVKEYTETLNENDSLIIIFSGHGIIDEETNECYWLSIGSQPNDYTSSISVTQIINLLKKLDTLHTLLIVDSCFSPNHIIESDFKRNEHLEYSRSRWVLSSGRMVLNSDDNLRMSSAFIVSLTRLFSHFTKNHFRLSEMIEKLGNIVQSNLIANPLLNSNHENGEFVFRLKHFDDEILFDDYYKDDRNTFSDEEKLWSEVNQNLSVDLLQKYLSKYQNGEFKTLALNKIQGLNEENEWSKVLIENSIPKFKKFIKKYPESDFVEEANHQIKELAEFELWEKVETSKTKYYLNKYINEYPDGKFQEQVNQLLKESKQKKSSKKSSRSRNLKSKRKRSNNSKSNKFILDKPLIIILVIAIMFSIYLWLR